MKRLFAMVLVLVAATAVNATGGSGGPEGSHHVHGGPAWMWGGPLGESSLFPPDFVLANQSRIGLTDEQILAITKDVGATHDKVSTLHESLKSLSDQLRTLLDAPLIDEKAAMAQASQLMDLEKQVKTAHIGLMIRVKNQLTPDQQQKLRDLRPPRPPMPADAPAPDSSF